MLNHINIMSRLVADPELLKTGSGRSYCRLRLACVREGTGYGDRDEITDWLDATAWGKTAEFVCKYFAKGDLILLDGALHSRTWKDREGRNRYSVEISVDNVYFCGGKNRKNKSEDTAVSSDGSFTELDDMEGELPFSMGEEDDLPL